MNLLNCCGADEWQTVFLFHLHVTPRYIDEAKDRLVLPLVARDLRDGAVLATATIDSGAGSSCDVGTGW